ncbi:MAG: RecQ family ATP-dependent DNA helicase [Chloroflexi bacterium]|nr:RecQ family ATP-dependent DNA helicase [Chloroflexota bacterium]
MHTSDITATLNTRFRLPAFRPGQSKAIQNLLAGQHTLVVMPTGSGKSLIYQLATLHRPGLTVVISPLIALMQNQVSSLTQRDIPATYINSTLSTGEQSRRLRAMTNGDFQLVYVAPERLRSVPFQQVLRQVNVGLLAVDEAHCISQWGHDFRPDYRHIAKIKPLMGDPVTVALTATATPQVQDDIVQALDFTSMQRIITGFNRPNLFFSARHAVGPVAKLRTLRALLNNWADGAAIIYVGTRRDAEEVAEFLRNVVNLDASHYHAGLDTDSRQHLQETFLDSQRSVMVATNAFGMGIDRPDVRLVVHYSITGTMEAYYQEAGRAGRDGDPAQAVLFYDPQDQALQKWFIRTSILTRSNLHNLYDSLRAASGTNTWTSAAKLALGSGIPQAKVKLGLAQLEVAGALVRLGDKGKRMQLYRGEWDEAAIKATLADSERYRRHRETQLARMIAYAESNDCRRRIILAHFGDTGPSEIPRCCDNCMTSVPAPMATESRGVSKPNYSQDTELAEMHQIILNCAQSLPGQLPRSGVAKLLVGSSSKRIDSFKTHPDYGRLTGHTRQAITHQIDVLIERGDLILDSHNKVTVAQEQKRLSISSSTNSVQRVVQLGKAGSPSSVPELITALQSQNGNVRRLAASALGKIGDARAVMPLLDLLAREQKPQVRQYAVKALGKIRDPRSQLVLQQIASNENERDYTQKAARTALKRLKPALQPATDDQVATFLAQPQPRPLTGPWDAGWALDFHSRFVGADWSRSQIGELAFRLKYRQDRTVLPALMEHLQALCIVHPTLTDVDAIVPVPLSTPRDFDPVRTVAEVLGILLDRQIWPVLVKTRSTAPQKDMYTLPQKRANVAGAFALQGQVRSKRLLVLDDLYDSGATLEQVTRILRRGGAAHVCVVTLTRTIHANT